MKTIRRLLLLSSIVCAFTAGPLRAEDEIEKAFRDALYAEEVKGDAESALKAYQEVGAKFEQQRDMAATALFRQGECLRKLGRKDEAAAIYNKVLAQYPDKERFARLSRESLAALGRPAAAPATESVPGVGNNTEIARLEKLLKDSPDLINATDSSNPLAGAAETGQVELVDYLLKQGARVDTVVDGKSALHRAAEAGHLTICQRLLDKGADVNLKSGNATPLIVALDKGRFAVAELLLDRKADANAGYLTVTRKEEFNNAPVLRLTHELPSLSLALMRRAPAALVMRLLGAGADPARPAIEYNAPNAQTKTLPLAEAIRRRETEIVAAILAKGFPVNQAVSGGEWPMDIAMTNARPSAPDATDDAGVEALRKHGADLKRDQVIRTAVRKGFTGYIRAAVKDGASPQHLDVAIESKNHDSLKLLLELGADPAKVGQWEEDAMFTAIRESNWDAIQLLLAKGYPLEERLVRATIRASFRVFDAKEKPTAESQKVFDFFKEKAEKAGVMKEAMTKSLDDSTRAGGTNQDNRALLRHGADAWKAETVRQLFQDQQRKFGIPRPDFTPLWKAARILNNPQLRSAIWASRGPSLTHYDEHAFTQSGTPQYRPFFRAVISEKGIVPPGTLGRFLVAYGWNVHTDELTNIVVSRLTDDGTIQEQVLDFVAIAKAGDVAKDYPLQWGDVIEIPPSYFPSPGSDSTADQRRKEIVETVTGFMDAHYREIEIGLTIGDDQILTNAQNEKGPVLRVPPGMDPLRAAGLPMNTDPRPVVEIMRAGDEAFTRDNYYNNPPARHGDRIRILPPPRDASLSDEALRDAFTLGVSDKGPFLRVYQASMGEIAGTHQVRGRPLLDLLPLPVLKLRLRDILLMLHGPNPFGFGPVNWSAARCKLANNASWEEMPLSEASLDWPVVPGIILILPPLDPSAPTPQNDFDYAACAVDFEVAIGDQPPVTRRYQPPVPELKRSGDKWHWSWKRSEGDSRFAWPDLGSIISELPEVKDWPGWNGVIKFHEGAPPRGSMIPGLWLRKEWKGIRLDKAAPNAIPPQVIPGNFSNLGPASVTPMPLPQPGSSTPVPRPASDPKRRVILPTQQ